MSVTRVAGWLDRMLRGVLIALIVVYRRWVSGRGPLRGVVCSFAPGAAGPEGESCSAYGLRAAREAPTTRAALGRIARRLRRCGDVGLVADGAALSWAAAHDQPPAALRDAMVADAERAPAIERMLASRRAVAVWRAELPALRACGRGHRRPPVHAAAGIARRARDRIARFATFAVLAALLAWSAPWSAGLVAAALTAATAIAARTAIAWHRRLALHRAWAIRRA